MWVLKTSGANASIWDNGPKFCPKDIFEYKATKDRDIIEEHVF